MRRRTTFRCLAALPILAFGLNLHGASTFKFEYSQYSAGEDTPSVLVAVLRSGDLAGPASVEVLSSDMTATAGEDYETTSLTVEFADGEEVQTFSVPLLNDGTEEPDEQFGLLLLSPSEGSEVGTPGFTTITLKDNDPGVQFTWKHFWGYEANEQLTAIVERGNDVDLSPFTVHYATGDLTARAGQDYAATTATLAFAEGEMSKIISIRVTDDAVAESRETFQITLSAPTGPGGLGKNITTTCYVYDTTGHEPRRFGSFSFYRGMDGTGPVFGLRGSQGGTAPRFELFGLESCADLLAWQATKWVAWDPTVEEPLCIGECHVFLARACGPELAGQFYAHRFFRMVATPLGAAWPALDGRGPDIFGSRGPCPAVDHVTTVGYTERWLTDPSRRNRYGFSDNSSFRVAIWYPAVIQAGVIPKQFISDNEMHYWMDTWEYHENAPDPETVTYAFPDVPFDVEHEDCPIVLFSHGGNPINGTSHDCFMLAEHLARMGYVVVAPDHSDVGWSTLPDGTFHAIPGAPPRSAEGFADRVRDFDVVLAALNDWQASDPILQGRLDTTRLAAAGYHWGGGVAAELCRTVANCHVGVLLNTSDQSFTGATTLLSEGPGKPLMFVQQADNSRKDLYQDMDGGAVWFQIAGSTSSSLYSWYAWDNAWGSPGQNLTDREVSHTLLAYAESFLTHHLGSPESLWQGPSPEHPRVINYERK
ncbi:MAG: hypothetical protein H7A46_09335 [Verrucomicrobiales bacterium]|nr:hypothetical protein [Verrucomicrobiales bacterium]